MPMIAEKPTEEESDFYHDTQSGLTLECRENQIVLPGEHVFSAAIILVAADSYRRSAVQRDWKTTNGCGREIVVEAPRSWIGG